MQQIRGPAGDRRRRIKPTDGPGCIGPEALEKQGVVRAGEHDRVGTARIGFDKAARDLRFDGGIVHDLARQMRFSVCGEPGRADQVNVATFGKFAD